ncbi:uL14 family ribosomal protein [Candidatus Deianiraea vastatrix]|uniref:Large ribosomal subunit protein uL14 n=1 Tax=Candidatus Deianiraea vastatrix TaxID=2163644 RepID=A0A5B8XCW2_9RICK|nr:uL14 family ribosomal protein [Candidatus Deianiraea vastatrix]QED23198.1 50S ribosomal protein L14 [Candidatus Deianiraea vastatrix]
MGIQKETVVNVCDNSGAIVAQCIHVYSGKSSVGVGVLVKVSVKKVLPNGKLKKGAKFNAIVVRTRSLVSRDSGSVSFSSNAVVLLNEKLEMTATRVFGPVPSELRRNPNCLKIVSLSYEVV